MVNGLDKTQKCVIIKGTGAVWGIFRKSSKSAPCLLRRTCDRTDSNLT